MESTTAVADSERDRKIERERYTYPMTQVNMWEMNFFPPFHARLARKSGGSRVNSMHAL